MSNVNVPSGPGDRRLRVWRLLGTIAVMVAALALGYSFLQDKPPAPPTAAEAPKDIAASFVSIQGNVKTRGVGGLDWRTAEIRVPLRKSDLVRTYPSSAAEIKFFDETRVTAQAACSLPGFLYNWYRPDGRMAPEAMAQELTRLAGRVLGLKAVPAA